MSYVITAPDRDVPEVCRLLLFAAGGITDCPDWQREATDMFADVDDYLALVNPRRPTFNVRDPNAAPEQIQWEHDMLRRADGIMFWFCEEALQPIALYELGAWSMTTKPLFVGAHPNYPRRLDVIHQTRLIRPEVRVHDSLLALVESIKADLRANEIEIAQGRTIEELQRPRAL